MMGAPMNDFDQDLQLLALRLRMGRAAKNLTQTEAAKRARLSQAALSLQEKGKSEPGAIVIKRLAAIYGVSTDWLLGITDEEGPAA